ncbi:hypothetical protein, partial [Flavonifractor sp. An306]|uniref:hypothetical protein n=1 Tax=Flavonifractor sp. An306 TaxID=1965629 RepID=UPI001A9AD651
RHHVKLQLHLPTPVCTYFTMVFSSGESFVNSSTAECALSTGQGAAHRLGSTEAPHQIKKIRQQ